MRFLDNLGLGFEEVRQTPEQVPGIWCVDFGIAKNAFFEDPNQTAGNILFYVEGGVPKALAVYASGSKIGVSIERGSWFKVLGC